MNYYTISQLVTTPNPQWLPVRHLQTYEEGVTRLHELRQENPGTIFELDEPTS
jgi:hypothetical protein